MSTDLATTNPAIDADALEQVLLSGDLSKLTAAQRVQYYLSTCKSLGLNPLSKPFDYIVLNGKLTLYARKDCADQLRARDHISIGTVTPQQIGDIYVVTATVSNGQGRTDAATGAVCIAGKRGEDLANAMMKAETKAKRRATLSICGLGMTDESEIDSIPDARRVTVDAQTGEIQEAVIQPPPASTSAPPAEPQNAPVAHTNARPISEAQQKRLFAIARESGWEADEVRAFLNREYGLEHSREIPRESYDEIVDTIRAGRDARPPADGLQPEGDSIF